MIMPSTIGRCCVDLLSYAAYPVCVPARLPPTSIRWTSTAGEFARIAQKSRAPGRFASFSALKLVEISVDATSTTGDSPVTVTVSSSVATRSSASMSALKPRPTTTPSRMKVVNPGSSNTSR